MTEHIILYTSQSEGITLGASGDTWMECLLALSDEFGEGILPLYEKAKEELTNVSAAVAETFAEELEGINEDIAKAVIREAEKGQQDATSTRDKVRAALAEPPAPEPDSGAEQATLEDTRTSSSDEDAAVLPTGSDTTSVCSICGADTTPDYAKLTKIEYGEARCPDCTP